MDHPVLALQRSWRCALSTRVIMPEPLPETGVWTNQIARKMRHSLMTPRHTRLLIKDMLNSKLNCLKGGRGERQALWLIFDLVLALRILDIYATNCWDVAHIYGLKLYWGPKKQKYGEHAGAELCQAQHSLSFLPTGDVTESAVGSCWKFGWAAA